MLGQVPERVDRVRGPLPANLDVGRSQAVLSFDGELHHRQPILGGDQVVVRAMRRLAARDQPDLVEREPIPGGPGHVQVTEVDRVERPSVETQPLDRHAGRTLLEEIIEERELHPSAEHDQQDQQDQDDQRRQQEPEQVRSPALFFRLVLHDNPCMNPRDLETRRHCVAALETRQRKRPALWPWIVWLILLPSAEGLPRQEDEAEENPVARRFDQAVREVQQRARSDGDRIKPNLDTIQKLLELEAEYRDQGVPPERLAYVLYNAADRLHRKLDDVEAAAAGFREAWRRYPETQWGGQESLRRFRELTMLVGATFPALEGRRLDDTEDRLEPQRAELTIVAFLEPRQPLCRHALEQLWRGLKQQPKDVQLVIGAVGDVADRWEPWLAARGIEAPTLVPLDPAAADWPTQFALEAVPRFFLLDRESTVLADEIEPASLLGAVSGR